MPQNVKIQTGFPEKTSDNYNSTQHSISIDSSHSSAPQLPTLPLSSPKQIRYILQIAKKIWLSDVEIKCLPSHFEKVEFSSLTGAEASETIDHLNS